MVAKPIRAEVIGIPIRPKLLKQIEDFRYARRIPSRAEAMRRLIEAGLEKEANGGGCPGNDHEPDTPPPTPRMRRQAAG